MKGDERAAKLTTKNRIVYEKLNWVFAICTSVSIVPACLGLRVVAENLKGFVFKVWRVGHWGENTSWVTQKIVFLALRRQPAINCERHLLERIMLTTLHQQRYRFQ